MIIDYTKLLILTLNHLLTIPLLSAGAATADQRRFVPHLHVVNPAGVVLIGQRFQVAPGPGPWGVDGICLSMDDGFITHEI